MLSCEKVAAQLDDEQFVNYIVNPKTEDLKFYWKKNDSIVFQNFKALKSALLSDKKRLVFATNGGMFNRDFSPQGLYIENGITKQSIDTTKNGYGNFYLQPNGIFYIDNNGNSGICKTERFPKKDTIEFATQSGPLLLIDGDMHPAFNKGSKNVHIRNGVGILPNGNLLFVMSKEKINFYDFAMYFELNGCKNALYLDGFVSRVYLPSKKWEQHDGQFGVIIGVTEPINDD